jgi:hypothetical protein
VEPEEHDRWFAVRCLFQGDSQDMDGSEQSYEERITLWRAASLDDAIARAEAEAAEYAEFAGLTHVAGFEQSYPLADAPPRDGAEVFALTRSSGLPPQVYVEQFFATGRERQA